MLTHFGTTRIETERLLLRPFDNTDADAMFRNWANDSDVTKYLTWTPHGEIKNTENLLNLWTSEYNRRDVYNWAIVLKDINEPIGGISVVIINDKAEFAEIGYCIGKYWWGNGIMTEAFSAVISYLFDNIGFNSIRAYHDTKNPASGKVMKKCRLKLEGILRDYTKNNAGCLIDIAMYSILKSEYNKAKTEVISILKGT